MKKNELTTEGLADLAYKAESDHEVQMARAELYKVAKYAIKLHEMMKNVSEAEGLEGWVQAKITKAADYISSVYHHMDYETKFDEVQEAKKSKPDFLDVDKDGDKKEPMKKAIKDKKEKKDESYKSSLASMLESKLSKDKVFSDKQIKMAYGVANDKRYKAGNYSGAVAAIEKIAKGLSKHPDVQKVLQRTNEEKQKGVDGKACWKGYKRMGTKKKGDKTVDNCVKM